MGLPYCLETKLRYIYFFDHAWHLTILYFNSFGSVPVLVIFYHCTVMVNGNITLYLPHILYNCKGSSKFIRKPEFTFAFTFKALNSEYEMYWTQWKSGSCFLCGLDGIILSPLNQTDINKLCVSVSSCIWKRALHAFFQVF